MIKKILTNCLGFAAITFAIFLGVAIATYSSADPSFIKANDAEVIGNWMGFWGAYIAGPMIQIFGATVIVIIAFFVMVGYKLLARKELGFLIIKFSLLLIVIPMLAAVLSYLGRYLGSKLEFGGLIGNFLSFEISTKYQTFWPPVILSLASLLGIVIIFNLRLKVLFLLAKGLKNMIVRSIIRINYFFAAKTYTPTDTMVTDEHHLHAEPFLSQPQLTGVGEANDDNSESAPFEIDLLQPLPFETTDSKVVRPQPSVPPQRPAAASASKSNKQPQAGSVTSNFTLPSVELLKNLDKPKNSQPNESALLANSKVLQKVLEDFGVMGEITKIHPGPVVTLYEFEPVAGTKSSRVIGLSDDIARSMSAISARIAVIPGKSSLGIELPNAIREMVGLKELVESGAYTIGSNEKLPLILGKNIGGEPIIADLAKMPHLLVAGTTGSGKSVAINTMILSLLFKHPPSECRFIMVDPKMLELSIYDGIPHLLAPVVTEPKKAISALKWVVKEMENRYRLMSLAGVRNLDGYNELVANAKKTGQKLQKQVQVGFDAESGQPKFETIDIDENHLPYIVVIVDEMADLMIVAGKEIEGSIQRLAQMARAAGIHIIMATQRPSVDVITGVIKANFPTRISFQVTSKIDSRTILGEQGADQLLGMGDMLFMRGGGRIERVHGPFVSDLEVEKITNFLRAQGAPQYIENITVSDEDIDSDGGSNSSNGEGGGDDLYDEALAIVLKERKASTSYIQRCLRIGYNRAANIIDRMEKERIVSAPNHVGKRDVLQD